MMNPSPLYLLSCLVVLLLLPLPSLFADPDPLQDFCIADLNASTLVNGFPCKPASKVTSDDFVFDGLSKEGNTSNIFGLSIIGANVLSFPGLNTLGVSLVRIDLAIGGIVPPHSHPRATEAVLIASGHILVGLVTTGNVYYSKVLTAGQLFIIPRGLVHFQLNVGPGKALLFNSFNSQSPGVALIPLNIFGTTPTIPNDVLTKSFQVGDDVINSIKSKFGS
ncbi:hypothetical protein SLA2020_272920 [Shorea laevis]